MSKRLEILERSLSKKKAALEDKFDAHFSDVKRANGQPLNDKRNGRATMDRWERQNNSIRRQNEEVEKTERAIQAEIGKIVNSNSVYEEMPAYLKSLVDSEVLIQWRKHPRILFVNGVDIARIYFDEDTKTCSHKYTSKIPTKEQYAIFRDVYNDINARQRDLASYPSPSSN